MGYISLPISTDPTISDNVSMASINPDICEHKPEDYVFEERDGFPVVMIPVILLK